MSDERPGTLHDAVSGLPATPVGTDPGEPGPTPRRGREGLQ
ncbi:hypothetical protein ACIOJE_19545 [Kitasatospora sp. NPDC087861]